VQVDRADNHAKNVGWDKAQLRSSKADDTNDKTVDATEHPAFPTAPANQDGGRNG